MAIYLFYGEETYLLETKVKRIKKEFTQLIQGINFIQIDDTNAEELISDLETPAFGFDKKLIIAKNTGLFKKEKKTSKSDTKKKKNDESKLPLYEKIAKYIEKNKDELNESVDLIFVEQEADKNTLYQTIEKVGEVKEFTLLKLPELITNIKKIASAYKVNINNETRPSEGISKSAQEEQQKPKTANFNILIRFFIISQFKMLSLPQYYRLYRVGKYPYYQLPDQ